MISHYGSKRRLIDLSLFDSEWYTAQYPDVSLSGVTPVDHYVRYGHRMLRDPSANVSIRFINRIFGPRSGYRPVAQLRLGDSRRRWPTKIRALEVLAAAGDVAEDGRPDLACALAEAWLTPKYAHTAGILRANRALMHGDEAGWLDEVNAYLAHYEVSPVGLQPGGSITEQLVSATDLPAIDTGPLVSVIMAAWNAEATIEASVKSILSQTWKRMELLIVDDASTDGTWSVLQRLAERDSRVRIFRNTTNVGPYVSKNIAVTQANGAWLTGHDADDWAHPQRIERQVRFCVAADSEACLAGMLRVAPDGTFVRLNPIGGNVHDGACRNAFISLMVDARVFHGGIGAWDNVRVAGDSELIHRLQTIIDKPIPSVAVPTMFCLDNPVGLTNSATLGHSERGGVASARSTYKTTFKAFHRTLDNMSSRYDVASTERRFQVPRPMLDAGFTITAAIQDHVSKGLRLRRKIETDVAIVTNLRFPGGNASSTLDEIRLFQSLGLKVTLVHAPVRRDIARRISSRYDEFGDIIVDWPRIETLHARILIVRHPATVVAPPFQRIAERLTADHAYVVKNNSYLRSDGTTVYDIATMVENASVMRAKHLEFCPISPAMRGELIQADPSLTLSPRDWNPTLDPALYLQPPKSSMSRPFRLGRHGRDGVEKWHEDRSVLADAYPADQGFSISILGGADRARQIIGTIPENWEVIEFGAMAPKDYLGALDLFVYFPKSTLVEGFGRGVAEAMMAGVPCQLPASFEATFGNLAFYVPPGRTRELAKALADDDAGRIAFLEEVQAIALDRYSSDTIRSRFASTGVFGPESVDRPVVELTAGAIRWRNEIISQVMASR